MLSQAGLTDLEALERSTSRSSQDASAAEALYGDAPLTTADDVTTLSIAAGPVFAA